MKMYISWRGIGFRCEYLAGQIRAEYGHDMNPGIIAVSRGGMIPAAMIANILETKLIDLAGIDRYNSDGEACKGKWLSYPMVAKVSEGAGWVIVDDLVDEGLTAMMIKGYLPQAKMGTLYAKPKGVHHLDFEAYEVPQDTWLVFPWEQDGE